MILNLAAIAIVGGLTYLWMTRGFFSAFLNMVCVIAAGAIAFALWEPVSYFLLDKAPTRGLGVMLGDAAWGIGLAIPFAIALALLRGVVDGVIRANAVTDSTTDYVGGGVCGLVSGIITAGVVALSIGSMRIGTESPLAAAPLSYSADVSGRGSLVRAGGLWVPVDRITAGIYGTLSETTLASGEPLAKWYPDLDVAGPSARMNFGKGKARNTLKPTDFKILGSYVVGDPARGEKASELLSDAWSNTAQSYVYLDKEPFTQGYLYGAVVEFLPGAKEKGGQVTVGQGQVRLVAQDAEGEKTITVHPAAVVSQGQSASIALGRWRFDSDDIQIASVGGVSNVPMAFEFPLPVGYRPIGLYVKNVRYEIDPAATPSMAFGSASERDNAIATREILMSDSTIPIDGGGLLVGAGGRDTGNQIPGVTVNNVFAKGKTLQRGTEQGLRAREKEPTIYDGEAKLAAALLQRRGGLEKTLVINKFEVTPDTVIVQLELSLDAAYGPMLEASDKQQPPRLVDTNGTTYDAVGFIYFDDSLGHVRYTPGRPLTGLIEAPSLSRSKTNQSLILVFRVSLGVSVQSFAIGSQEIIRFETPIACTQSQRNS
ncbi:MAG: CvpA family protein [Phycisphaerales bacterium]|jgi:hypothetical protein|nr:CvpA family protein [Phycisphaerales bacterium]